jgi:hypothetical protein
LHGPLGEDGSIQGSVSSTRWRGISRSDFILCRLSLSETQSG